MMLALDTSRRFHRPEDIPKLQRHSLLVVFISQVLGGLGLAAGITVGGLLAQDLLSSDRLAGLPIALFTAGSAGAAFAVGRLSSRFGRRVGLATGYLVGAAGGAGVVVAAATGSALLLLVSLTVYGSGTATNLQARYAGSDLAEPDARGRAMSAVLVGTTLGAIAGPAMTGPTSQWASALGIPGLAGSFALAALAYVSAALVLLVFLRPDPLLVAQRLGLQAARETRPDTEASPRLGAVAMALTQLVMVAIMTMTPIHMRLHHLPLDAVGMVIAVHVGAMYLPSPVSGWAADRWGRLRVLHAAAVCLLLAGVVAASAPAHGTALVVVALGLLGLGWNFGIVAGSALIADSSSDGHGPRRQAAADVLVALSGAAGGIASGVLMDLTSYGTLALTGGLVALLIWPAARTFRRGTAPLADDQLAPASAVRAD